MITGIGLAQDRNRFFVQLGGFRPFLFESQDVSAPLRGCGDVRVFRRKHHASQSQSFVRVSGCLLEALQLGIETREIAMDDENL